MRIRYTYPIFTTITILVIAFDFYSKEYGWFHWVSVAAMLGWVFLTIRKVIKEQ